MVPLFGRGVQRSRVRRGTVAGMARASISRMRSLRLPGLLFTVLATAALLTSCGSTGAAPAVPPILAVPSTSTAIPPVPALTPSTITTPVNGQGWVVVLDPGHNGGNAAHPAEINRLVPSGRGQHKACNTTGTSTDGGYPEHAFAWDVAVRVRAALTAKGFRVLMTRQNDDGVGPCVDQRAAIGDQAQAAAVVSIHADGSDAAGARGFHVEYSAPPLNAAQGRPSIALATALRDAVRSAGFPLSNYLGSAGLYGRSDLGGLNLSERPTALIECGNMRDPTDAVLLSSVAGRERYARAITAAIVSYLGGS